MSTNIKYRNGTGCVILREQPLKAAEQFHQTQTAKGELGALRRYRHTWYRWEGPRYRAISSEEARVDLTEFLAASTDPTGAPFHPRPSDVSATLSMLMSYRPALIEPTIPAPGWLPEATDEEKAHDPLDLISCKNGLVNLRTGKILPHTPHFLTTSATSYNYAAAAKRARFEKFLDEIFPGSAAERPKEFDSWLDEDREPQLQRELLQEVFGYLISRETRQQKIFLFIGKRRTGKGTLARVLRQLIGELNAIGFSLDALDNDFGAEDLIDKQLAIVGDARLDGSSSRAVAQLLTWSGEDPVTINRKGEKKWQGTLGVRFLIMTNTVLHFSDPSGTIASRFIPVLFKESFEGREDETLTEQLLEELPGILNWAIDGWRRLRDRRKFVLPTGSQEALQRMEKKAAPMLNFVEERCVLGEEQCWTRDDCYAAYVAFCQESNNKPLSRPKFVEALEDLNLGIKCRRPKGALGEKERPFVFFGVGKPAEAVVTLATRRTLRDLQQPAA